MVNMMAKLVEKDMTKPDFAQERYVEWRSLQSLNDLVHPKLNAGPRIARSAAVTTKNP